MRVVTEIYHVYTYDELSKEAKEKAKQWYLDDHFRSESLTEMIQEDLNALFANNDLKPQWSLSSCQGDGVNIYGEICAKEILECLEKNNGGTQLGKFRNLLTDKEKRTVLHYAKECDTIKLPMNTRYCYSLADRIDVTNDWEYQLENYSCWRNINIDTIKKFEKIVRGIFSCLCREYEKMGYEYLYTVDEEEMSEACSANNWEFLEDGTYF